MSGKNLSLKDTGQTQRNCAVCGLPVGTAQRGSLTGWIFRENRCKCSGSFTPIQFAGVDGSRDSTVAADTSETDDLLGSRYQIVQLVDRGGMGAVYKAHDTERNTICAVKVLRSELASDNLVVQRFEQEAVTSQNLNHPNIVRVYDYGMSRKGAPFLVMDFLEGETLAQIIERDKTVAVPRFINIFQQVCDAISYAHANQIIHRDLKPTNIFVTKSAEGSDVVKLVDFGIAKVLPTAGRSAETITQTGDVFGSPLYMSPEQCRGDKLDVRSDIYSLGCAMYEALSGRPPFVEESPIKLVLNHLYDEPASIPDANPMLEKVVLTCLQKKPSGRYANAVKLKRDLLRFGNGQTPTVCSSSIVQTIYRTFKQNWALSFCTFLAITIAVPLTLAQADLRWISMVDVLNKTNSPTKREEIARQLVSVSTYNKPFSLLMLAEVLRTSQRTKESKQAISDAIDELERRGERNANLVYAYRELLRVAVEERDFKLADATVEKMYSLVRVCDPFVPCKGPRLMLEFYSRCPMVHDGDEIAGFFRPIADAFFIAGDDARAEKVLQQTISLAKKPVSLAVAHKSYAWFLGVVGREDEARAERRKSFELLKDLAPKQNDARVALKNLAEDTTANKGFAEAGEMFKIVLAADSDPSISTYASFDIDHMRVAYCLELSGAREDADKYFKKTKVKDDLKVLFAMANFCSNRKNYDEAMKHYAPLMVARKKLWLEVRGTAIIRYADCLYNLSRFEEAEKAVADGIIELAKIPANQYKMVRALKLRGQILEKLGRKEEAAKTLKSANTLRASLTPTQLFAAKKEHLIWDVAGQNLDFDQPWR